jgi:putative phosphoribosyl transferase
VVGGVLRDLPHRADGEAERERDHEDADVVVRRRHMPQVHQHLRPREEDVQHRREEERRQGMHDEVADRARPDAEQERAGFHSRLVPRRVRAGNNPPVRIVPWIPPLFRDRAAAGRVLAEAVRGVEDAVVVGVARGGVAVAAEVAAGLGARLTAVDVERVNASGLRLGATTANGPPYLLDEHGVPDDEVAAAVARARLAAEVLEARLEHEQLPVAGRATLVVDDGAITGLTLAAACAWARAQEAARVVAAVPVAHVDCLARLREEADEVVCPHPLEQIAVVGQAYDSFDPLDEWYLAGLLSDR